MLHFKRGRVIEIETVTLKVKASGGVEFDTPEIRTTGKIVSAGDQVAAGISQVQHAHTGVMPGSGQSGPPVGVANDPARRRHRRRVAARRRYQPADLAPRRPDDRIDDPERFGWWGDSFPSLANDRIGSRLWQLRRAKLTAETAQTAEAFAREALAWMLEDGRVTAVAVTTTRGVDRLELQVLLTLRDGRTIDVQLDNLWQVINAV